MKFKIIALSIFPFFFMAMFVSECTSLDTQNSTPTVISTTPTITPSPTVIPTATFTPTATPTPTPTNHPGWMPEGVIARFGMGIYSGMAISPNNSIVAVSAASGVYFIDPLIGRTTDFLETGAKPYGIVFSPNGEKIYIALGSNGVAIWERDETNTWRQEETLPYLRAEHLGISKNGEILFTKFFDGALNSKFIAWDLTAQKQLYQSNYAQAWTSFAMAFSPTDPDLMAVAANQTVKLMDVKSGKTVQTYSEPNKNKVVDLGFSPDGSKLVIASESQEAILLNVENAEEVGRIKHSANVLKISFIDNNKLVAFTEKSSIIEDVTGKLIKNLNRSLYEWDNHYVSSMDRIVLYAYVPTHNLLVMGDDSYMVSVSLDNYEVVSKIDGFNRYGLDASSSGNAFLWDRSLLIYSDDFFKQTYLDIYKLCSDAQYIGFADNGGKYISVSCGEGKFLTVESKTMKTVSSFPLPLAYTSNTYVRYHPWSDDRELMALVYENPNSSPAKYRIEIQNPIQNKKISTLDVNITDFKGSHILFSPQSKYLVVMPPDEKNILVYDVDSGSLFRDIKLNTPQPLNSNQDIGSMFLDGDDLFFTRYSNFVEVYSLERGELVQEISNLKLHKPNYAETFSIKLFNNFFYFDKTKTLMVYEMGRDNRKNLNIMFTSYNIESGKKISTTSIQMPYEIKSGEKVNKAKLSLAIDDIYLPLEQNGNIAVVKATLHDFSTTVYDSTIYVVDIPTNTILKNYTWQYGTDAYNSFDYTLIRNNFLISFGDSTLLFDISMP